MNCLKSHAQSNLNPGHERQIFPLAPNMRVQIKPSTKEINTEMSQFTRRDAFKVFGVSSSVFLRCPDAKAIDQNKPQEFTNVGTQAPAPLGENDFTILENGVKIKDFNVGTGDIVVNGSSKVMLQCSGRLLNLNGVVFYNTKNNNPDGFGAIPLSITLGTGEAIPGFESGIIGMKKGGIRRIIVPADLAYSKFPNLEPQPTNDNDRRALDSVVKNPRRDATILFDIKVERFK